MYFFKLWVWDGDNCQTFVVVVKLRLFSGFSTKDALTVGCTVNCFSMVVWRRFFARLRLRLSLVSLRTNATVAKNTKRNGKWIARIVTVANYFAFSEYFCRLSVFWEKIITWCHLWILPLGRPDWMLSVLAVAKRTWHHDASFFLIDRLTKDFIKRQEIIRDPRFDSIHSDSISAVHMCDFIHIIHNLRSVKSGD